MKKRAVFLDRDGTLNKDVGYPGSYAAISIYPYSFEAVRKLNAAGFFCVVVTNQSGVGRGLIEEKELHRIHEQMQEAFLSQNSRLDAIYYCPHYEASVIAEYRKNCPCRKPNPGMGIKAAAEYGLDLQNSYMIGDKTEDILFGLNIKATPILLLSGHGKRAFKELSEKKIKPAYVAGDLLEAANWIVARET